MSVRAFAHIVRAEFLERVRRHGFLVTLGVTLYGTYVFLPPLGAPYATLQITAHRGIYDSAWVGCSVALVSTAFLSIAGFYLVKNSIDRDRRTGVGAILASTPLTKPVYTLGKAASNFAVLATLTLLIAVGSAGMQLLRGESMHVDPLALLFPFVVVTLPVMAVAAGAAVLFESVPLLAGGFGNVVFVFAWSGTLAASGVMRLGQAGIGDLAGTSALLPQMVDATARAFADVNRLEPQMTVGLAFHPGKTWHLTTFDWAGPIWTSRILLGRLAWAGIGAALALVAAVPFDRFDASARQRAGPAKRAIAAAAHVAARGVRAATVGEPVRRSAASFGPLLLAELGLLVRGRPWAWTLVAAGLAVACWVTPMPVATAWILPIAWVWPMLVWSPLGGREAQHRTLPLLVGAPGGMARTFAAGWLAGFAVAVAIGAGVGVRHLAAGHGLEAVGWLAGAALPPAMAMACGAWTGSGRLFEVLYLLLWYIGPMNHMPELDYAGSTPATPGRVVAWAAVAAALLVVGGLGRLRSDPYAGGRASRA